MLRRVLGFRVSVEAMIEAAVWVVAVYVIVGLTWAFFHDEQMRLLQTGLETRLPAGSDIAAFLTIGALWPWEVLGLQLAV
ncbi:MAG: hypothetical protein QOH60_5002 [Mycobacterium sp.]|nr:hypothetical protein [Mycobacterium sp.]